MSEYSFLLQLNLPWIEVRPVNYKSDLLLSFSTVQPQTICQWYLSFGELKYFKVQVLDLPIQVSTS